MGKTRLSRMEIIPETMGYERISEMEQIAMKGGIWWIPFVYDLVKDLFSSDSGSGGSGGNVTQGGSGNDQHSGVQVTVGPHQDINNTFIITDPSQVTPSFFNFIPGTQIDSITIYSNAGTFTIRNPALNN